MNVVRKREEIPESDRWNLDPMYGDLSEWEQDFRALESELPRLEAYRGKLGLSAAALHEAVNVYTSTLRRLEKLYTYSHLRHDTDVGDSQFQALFDRAVNLYTRFAAIASYMSPELLQIPESTLEAYLLSPELTPYARMIREMTRYRPHTLSEPEEALLAKGAEVLKNSERVFGQLNNADLTFGEIETKDGKVPLTHATYSLLMRNSDRSVRARAYDQYMGQFFAHKNTFATTLSGNIKKKVFLAQVRQFPSALDAALFQEEVPPSIFHGLIDSVSEALPSLHRYLNVRKRILQIDSLRPYDNFVPLAPDVRIKTSFEEACELVSDACSPLGDEYVSTLRNGLTAGRWVDRYENAGKRSGAYSSGCYDSPPYILMNYHEEVLDHVFTLAHEAGHSMHSLLSNRHQSYQDHSYTIFLAEVASVVNEQLLLDRLLKRHADNPSVLRYLLDHQLEGTFGTFFVQTMFSEFERATHALAEKNEPLTTERFVSIYREVLQKYFGPDYSAEDIDGYAAFRIPHFYYNFYVFKYATGYASAVAFARKILAGDQETTARYLRFLQSAATKPPLVLLREAGVDLETPDPITETISVFDELVTKLETAFLG